MQEFNLILPPSSITDSSVALVWDKPCCNCDEVEYQVYVNDNMVGTTMASDYTIENLDNEKSHNVFVRAVFNGGEICSSSVKVETKPKSDIFDITEYGAVGDGAALNTTSIQNAIDSCTNGGTVYVPKGVFVSGALFLKSNMTLYVEEGGVVLGSVNASDYPVFNYRFEGKEQPCYASLINTKDIKNTRLENISICGKGKIDANGEKLRINEVSEKKGERGRAVCIRNTDNVYLKDITVKQSPAWCVHLIYCNNISANGIKIYSKFDEDGRRYKDICNGDGLNPDSSSNVYIFNSMIASQDDCIAIKSGRDAEGRAVGIPSENIRITDCSFKSGFGVVVGSEMSGSVRNVLVRDCKFENVYSVASIKPPRGRGGVIENIHYENCALKNLSNEHKDCEWFRGAIYIDNFYSHKTFDIDKKEEVNEGTPTIRNISFKNIDVETLAGNAIYLCGLPERFIENVVLENVTAKGKYGFKANNINRLTLKNVCVTSEEDDDYIFNNINKLN